MKLEKFNTLKLIHDNIPEVTFVISSFVYEAEIQLYHNYIIRNCDNINIDKLKEIIDEETGLEPDYFKFLNYSDLENIDRVDDIVEDVYHYNYFIIDMKK